MAPPAAAANKIVSASPRLSSGNWSVQAQIARAHDAEMAASASAWPTDGCASSRFIHPMAAAAAPPVIRVCHVSHDRAEPWPSSEYPPWLLNAASILAWADVAADSARASSRRHSAWSATGMEAASASFRNASPARTAAVASATLVNGWPVHTGNPAPS